MRLAGMCGAALVLAGCGSGGPGGASMLSSRSETFAAVDEGPSQRLERFDGRSAARVDGLLTTWPDASVFVLDASAGLDQAKLIVRGGAAPANAQYAFPHRSPYASLDHGVLGGPEGPIPADAPTLRSARVDGRELLLAIGKSEFSASVLAVLEAHPTDGLVPVAELWNWGHLQYVEARGPLLAIAGLDGTRVAWGAKGPVYGVTLTVLDARRLFAASGRPLRTRLAQELRGVAPSAEVPGLVLAAELPFDEEPAATYVPPTFDADEVRLSAGPGLVYHVDLATGRVRVTADGTYRAQFESEHGPEGPGAVDRHLADLAARTEIRRGPPPE